MAFCTKCGAQLGEDAAFCTKCGARATAWGSGSPPSGSPASAPPQPAPNPAATRSPAAATSIAGTLGRVQQAGHLAAAAAGAAGSLSLPWQTIASGGQADVGALVKAAAPSLLALAPRPNLRWPAAAIAFTLAMDVAITLLSGGAVDARLLAMRVVTGLGTTVLGAIVGAGTGPLRRFAGFGSMAFAAAQLVSLLATAWRAVATPITLLTLLPSIVSVASGLALAVSTALGGLKR